MAIFSGSLEACIAHIFEYYGDKEKLLSLLREFSGAPGNKTPKEWLEGKRIPGGLYMIKLQHFLSISGYEVSEMKVIDPLFRSAALAVALGSCTIEQIEQKLNISHNHAMRMLSGNCGTSSDRRSLLEELLKSVLPKQLEIQKQWQARLNPNGAIVSDDEALATQDVLPLPADNSKASNGNLGLTREQILQLAANMFQSALPLAEAMASEEFTAEERATLRSMSGKFTIFNLKNALIKLCGERARETSQN